MNRHPKALAGIALVIAAVACFAVLDTTTKSISLSVPLLMALWFRYMFQAVATTLAVLPVRGLAVLKTEHPKYQCLRGVLLLSSSLFAFFSLRYMPVGEFTAIVMISPLVITLMAATALKERVSILRWSLVAGGFIGTMVIIRPGADDFDWTMLLPLGLVTCNAWFQTLTSRLARTEDPVTMHFYTGWVGALLASLALPFIWVTPQTLTEWTALTLMGLMGTIGHFVLILAYRRAPAATLMPLMYVQIAFAMFAGWVVFGHMADGWSLLGMVLIAGCGATSAWLALRESRLKLDPMEV